MKMSKKILVLLLAVVFAFAMCACDDDEDDVEDSGVANPIVETDQAGVLEATGIEIAAPEGAEDVEYSYIKSTGGDDQPIAQVEFDFEDNEYLYRIQITGETSIVSDDENASVDALLESLSDCTNVGAQLAGMYCDWKAGGTTVVDYCDGVFGLNEGEAGFISWLDAVPGALYSLSMDEDCSQDLLQTMAETLFTPMQGDVG